MRRRSPQKLQTQVTDPVTAALARARRARRKGKARQEVNALREACSLREFDACLWTLLAVAWLRMSRVDDAVCAFRHALWLRERAGEEKRAAVTRRLLASAWRGESMDRAAA